MPVTKKEALKNNETRVRSDYPTFDRYLIQYIGKPIDIVIGNQLTNEELAIVRSDYPDWEIEQHCRIDEEGSYRATKHYYLHFS